MAASNAGYALAGEERISDAISAVAALPFPVVAAVYGLRVGRRL
jgi:hypothetical protein